MEINRPTLADLLSPEPTEDERLLADYLSSNWKIAEKTLGRIVEKRIEDNRLALQLAAEAMCKMCHDGNEPEQVDGHEQNLFYHPVGAYCPSSPLHNILAAHKRSPDAK
jgi:hypothetical protein